MNLFKFRKIMMLGIPILWATHVFMGEFTYGQSSPPITSSGLNTNISAPVVLLSEEVQHNITGGTRPGGGANLFHSFGDFNVPTDNIANFLNDSGLPTSNVLNRVTGGKPSNIFGTIQTEGFGNANLFLMNPAGIVFGSGASLNVGGSTHFTTADYLSLADGIQFTALPSLQDSVLNIAPFLAFGFLESTPTSIIVDGTALSVNDGQSFSLVGGDIRIGSGLKASGGQIALASVASPGEVLIDTYANAPNVNGESVTALGGISLLEGALLDVSADGAGSVIIRGGELVMVDATISANTLDSSGSTIVVDINISGNITIESGTNSAITAIADGEGHSGEVSLISENLSVQSFISDGETAIIDTSNFGAGNSGHVNLNMESGNLVVDGGIFSGVFIQSGSGGDGDGGNVEIKAGNAVFTDTEIRTGDGLLGGFGVGGNFSIKANFLTMDGITLATDSVNLRGGDLFFVADDIIFSGSSSIGILSLEGEAVIDIRAARFFMDKSTLLNQTALARGGGITVNATTVELTNNSQIASQTFGDGNAGVITVTATDHVTISDDPTKPSAPGGIFTNAFGDPDLGTNGRSGAIEITTPTLTMTGGTRIDSITGSSGGGGDVTINAQNVFISGQRNFDDGAGISGLGNTKATGIYTRTIGSALDTCTDLCGMAGNVVINSSSFNLAGGAVVNSGTTNNGQGGTTTVKASGNISIAGTLDDGTSGGVFSRATGTDPGSGDGGNIALKAGDSFLLSNGATVSASSSGPADAGNIELTATDTILIDGATVTTEAAQASGGDIKLTAQDLIRLNDSTISSSVQGNAMTGGGNISIDPEFIILQNSQILAKAVEGHGGNISLVATNAVLVDPLSVLDASSALGVSGSVDIEAPIQNLSGTIAPLPEETTPVTALYGARCAAGQGGNFSTFVDSKVDSFSPTPGRFLASPLLSPAADQANTVATSAGPQSQVILTASIAPLVLGYAGQPQTACP